MIPPNRGKTETKIVVQKLKGTEEITILPNFQLK